MIVKIGINPSSFRIVRGSTRRIKRGDTIELEPSYGVGYKERVKVVDIKIEGMKKFYIVERADG